MCSQEILICVLHDNVELQEQHTRQAEEQERSWSERHTQLSQELTTKLDHAAMQLNQYRSAFEGDAGAWTISGDPVSDAEIYVNLDTGKYVLCLPRTNTHTHPGKDRKSVG